MAAERGPDRGERRMPDAHDWSETSAWRGWPRPGDWYTYFVTDDWPHDASPAPGDEITLDRGRFRILAIRLSATDPDQGYPGARGVHFKLAPLELWPPPPEETEILPVGE
jgi:hypothetical protein